MATKVKPTRIQATGTPQVGDVPMYVDEDTFQRGAGGGGGSGDVSGPASSTDGDIVLFNGTTGKLIKDSGVGLSSKLDASALSDTNYGGAWSGDTTHTPTKNALYTKIHTMDVEIGNKAADNTVVKLSGNQTINGTKTFGTSPVVPSKTTAATNTGTAIATEAQVKLVADDVATINGMISSNASSSNKLMDKNYIDDSINSVTAYYITKNAQGDQWATYAELAAASTFYSGGVARTPTRNDYTIVLADENHDNATTRYIYNSGWEYQYTVNETALTQAQLDALNSGITSGKVSTYDGYASTISGKQDALTTQTAYTSQGDATKVPQITTNNLGQVTGITEVTITQPDISGKADKSNVLEKDNTTLYTPTGDYHPATKKYVDDGLGEKQDELVSGTNIKTINNESLLGNGNIEIQGGASSVDYLSQEGLVGELYTSSDKLFLQNTPTLENSIVSCNVGDTASNTEIHIQRIGSGTESNELKLNVKSVGSPTTGLVVEVRKGVQVTVTQDVEAYWYGDGNEIIATGSIASSSITSSYSEITVTLDNNFGGTEGELLDVVVYQTGSVVNASNYYVVGCDMGQYSEAFNYVSVNGNTRTRSNFMPYCLSDSFAQSLLVKKNDTQITLPTTTLFSETSTATFYWRATPNDGTMTWSGVQYTKTFDIGKSMSYDIVVKWTTAEGQRANGLNAGVQIILDGTAVKTVTKSGKFTEDVTYSSELSTGSHTLQIKLGASRQGQSQATLKNISLSFTPVLIKESDRFGKPLSNKEIGELGLINIFGKDGDDFFVGRKTSTTATVGSITPGNFVGYLEIGDYKIPYYNK